MQTIIGIYLIWMAGMLFNTFYERDDIIMFPSEIYETSHLNKLGSIVTSLVIIILNPLMFFIKFIDWFFHVGRED